MGLIAMPLMGSVSGDVQLKGTDLWLHAANLLHQQDAER